MKKTFDVHNVAEVLVTKGHDALKDNNRLAVNSLCFGHSGVKIEVINWDFDRFSLFQFRKNVTHLKKYLKNNLCQSETWAIIEKMQKIDF